MFGGNQPNTTSGGGFNFGVTANKPAGGSNGGFSFGANPGAATGAGTTGSFGSFDAGGAATTTAQTAGFNFGASAVKPSTTGFGNFSFGAAQQTQAPQTSTVTGFNFSTAAGSSGGGLTLGTSATGSNVFGGVKTAGPATTSSAPTSGTFAGFGSTSSTPKTTGQSLLGGLLSSTVPASATAPTTSTAAAPGGFTFGSAAISTAGSFGFGGTPTTSTAPSVTTAQVGGFGFGPTSQPATSAPTLGTGLGGVFSTSSTTTAVPASMPAATPVTSISGTNISGQKQMTFRQLEETINKWTGELEEQEKYFLDQATQVNAWDRIVMENGEKIIQLNKDVEKVKLDQQKLDHELDFIHSQQKELEDILTPLEKALDSLPPISYQQHADIEREHTYVLAESLDAQLKRMGQDLKEIIERLNSTNTTPDPDDPVQQITKILNAHVVSLMWVDRNTSNLHRRVEEISKQMDIEKREQERNFRLAYS